MNAHVQFGMLRDSLPLLSTEFNPEPSTAANATYVVETGNPRPEAKAITLALTPVITEARNVS